MDEYPHYKTETTKNVTRYSCRSSAPDSNRNVFKGGPGGPNDVTSFLSKLPWKAAAPATILLLLRTTWVSFTSGTWGKFSLGTRELSFKKNAVSLEGNEKKHNKDKTCTPNSCLLVGKALNEARVYRTTERCRFMDRFLLVYRQKIAKNVQHHPATHLMRLETYSTAAPAGASESSPETRDWRPDGRFHAPHRSPVTKTPGLQMRPAKPVAAFPGPFPRKKIWSWGDGACHWQGPHDILAALDIFQFQSVS